MSDPVLELPFSAGIAEGARPELIQPGAGWLELVNVRQDKRGGVSKRLGYDPLPLARLDAGPRTAGNRSFMNGDHVCTIDGTHLDVYSPQAGGSSVRSRVPEATFRTSSIWSPGQDFLVADILHVNGYVVTTYTSTTDNVTFYAHATLADKTSGAMLHISKPSLYESSDLTAAQLAAYGTYAIAFVGDFGTSEILAYYLDTASIATIANGWVPIGTIANDYSIAIAVESLSDRVAVAYANTSGGASRVTVKTLTIAGVLQTETVNTSSVSPSLDGVDLCGNDGDTLWVAWNEALDCKVQGREPLTLSTIKATTATIVTSISGVTRLRIAPSSVAGKGALAVDNGAAIFSRSFQTVAGAAATDSDLVTTYGAGISGRPFFRAGRYYMPASTDKTDVDDMTIVDWTPERDPLDVIGLLSYLRPVAAPIERGLFSVGSFPRVRFASDGDLYYHAYVRRASAVSQSAELLTLNFADPLRWQNVAHGGTTYLGGGLTAVFDGTSLFEAAFLSAPSRLSVQLGGTGETTTIGWRYVAVWEHVDANGNWHVSGVSDPVFTGPFTNNTVDVSCPPLAITARADRIASSESPLRVAFYRTTDGGEPPYYRVGTVESYSGLQLLIHSDSLSDAALQTESLLYGTGQLPTTNGAAQDRRAPRGLKHLVSYNGTLVGAVGTDIWYSAQAVRGEGLWFSPVFQLPIDDGGDITAMWCQDGTLYAAKRSRLFALAGDAPSDNGASGGLGSPRRISADFGSIDGVVVSTSIGTFFRSERGVELLSRAGQVEWIGEEISATLKAHPFLTSAVLDEAAGLVRFTLAAAITDGRASGAGVDLVFDLALGIWQSTDLKVSGAASQDAAMIKVDGVWRYGWLAANGTVYYERADTDGSAYLDVSTWITMRAVSPWLHIAGVQGDQLIDRILLLAERFTGHDLTISLAFDYVDAYTSTRTFSAATIAAQAREWLDKEVPQMTSNAVKVKLEDATPSSGAVGNGRGGAWICVTPAGTPHRGVKRTSGVQRGGSP